MEGLRPHQAAYALKLKGVDSRTQAEALAGGELLLPEDEVPKPGGEAFYHAQILGCTVLTVDGRDVGRVEAILPTGGPDLLVVNREGREVLIPFVQSIIKEVDPKRAVIVIDPPDGLLDLNEI